MKKLGRKFWTVKLLRTIGIIALFSALLTIPVFADVSFSSCWVQDESGNWKVRNSDGTYLANAWFCDDAVSGNGKNVWYLLDANGNMISAGLVQDGTGNYYSLETEHNGYYGMLRYKTGKYGEDEIWLRLDPNHGGSFAAILNEEGIAKLKEKYGVTTVAVDNSRCFYSSSIVAQSPDRPAITGNGLDATDFWDQEFREYYGNGTMSVWYEFFPVGIAEYYRTVERRQLEDWEHYLTDEYNRQICDVIAKNLLDQMGDDQMAVAEAVAFVQSLNYLSDGDGVEYPKYPIETLNDKGGDCEDTSILLCGILRSLGFDSVLIILPGHCAVGIRGERGVGGTYYDYNGRRYYYVETTSTGWKIGEMPSEYRWYSAELIGVN